MGWVGVGLSDKDEGDIDKERMDGMPECTRGAVI